MFRCWLKPAAHPIDIFSLAVTPTQILSASGASSLKVHSTTEPDFPVAQSIQGAHKIGCHHVVTSGNGVKAASVGFGGEVKIWAYRDAMWVEDGAVTGKHYFLSISYCYWIAYSHSIDIGVQGKAAEVWAIALSEDGQYLAGTTQDGHIKVWDLIAENAQIRDFETKGSFGMCIALVQSYIYLSMQYSKLTLLP